MKKKCSYQHILLLTSLIVIGLLSIQIIYSELVVPNQPVNNEEVEEKKTVPKNPDFASTERGLISAWTKERYYKEPIDSTIVLFSSEKIPGLALVYYPYEQKLVGGSPPMVIKGVSFFNGYPHFLGYSFEEKGGQKLFYDGRLIATSDFSFKKKSYLTGLVSGPAQNVVSETLYDLRITES